MRPSKRKQFDDYVNKWGMSDFRFFVTTAYGDKHLYIVKKGIKNAQIKTGAYSSLHINTLDKRIGSSDVFEITSLHRLLSRLNSSSTHLFICDEGGGEEFGSLEEIKRYFLIRKISGI